MLHPARVIISATHSLVRGWSNAGYEKECKKAGSSTSASQRSDCISIYDTNL
jgi:hypothetical protein